MRTQCILNLQRFDTFQNCCLFCTFWLLRNFYSGDADDANYCKNSLNNHFQYWTQCISDLQCFQTFRNCSFFCTSWLLQISTVVMRIMLSMANIVLIIISNITHTVYIRLKAFWNFSKLQFVFTFWLLRKFYCGDAHHAIYGKHSLNHHLQHCAHSVYQINSVF